MDTQHQNNATNRRSAIREALDDGLCCFRRFAMVLTVLGIIAILVILYTKELVHNRIRTVIQKQFSSHYEPMGIDVSIGSARFFERERIVVRDLVFRDSLNEKDRKELVRIDELVIHTSAGFADLVTQTIEPSLIECLHPKLKMIQGQQGTWSIDRLFPMPKLGDRPAPLLVKDGEVEFYLIHSGKLTKTSIDKIDVKVERVADVGTHLIPSEATAPLLPPPSTSGPNTHFSAPGDSQAVEPAHKFKFQGSCRTELSQDVEFSGVVDPSAEAWSTEVDVTKLLVSSEIIDLLPQAYHQQTAVLSSLRGNVDFNCKLNGGFDLSSPPEFELSGRIYEGQIVDKRLPLPLSNVAGQFRCTPEKINLWDITAQSGRTTLTGSCQRMGYLADSPMSISTEIKELFLDRSFVSSLPDSLRKLGNEFAPTGTVNVIAALNFDGQQWLHECQIDLIDVSYSFHKFPYRIGSCNGTVHINSLLCTVHAQALAAGQTLKIDGEFQNPGPNYTGEMDLVLGGPISLDEKLFQAMEVKPKMAETIRDFGPPTGMVTFSGKIYKTDPFQPEANKHFNIGLNNVSLSYKKFLYPISKISGEIIVDNDQIRFRDLKGYNDGGYITCDGELDSDLNLSLNFVGLEIPLEEELKSALNPTAKQLWEDLGPRGMIDEIRVTLDADCKTNEISLDIDASKWKLEDEVDRRSLSLYPRWFPYKLNNVTGRIKLSDGQLTLADVEAHHGKSVLSIEGGGVISQNHWSIALERFHVDRLVPDQDLISAFPQQLGESIRRLNVNGLVGVDGSVEFSSVPSQPLMAQNVQSNEQASRPVDTVDPFQVEIDWDLNFDLENAHLEAGVPIDHVHGTVRLLGKKSPGSFYCRGRFDVDSAMYEDVQFTSVKGPLWIDSQQVRLGTWAHTSHDQGPQTSVVAQGLGGRVSLDGAILFKEFNPFAIEATLNTNRLMSMANDFSSNVPELSGTINARVRLQGNSQGRHTFQGEGGIQLTNAKISEVPLILALLKIPKFKRVDRTAFHTCNMLFKIKDEHFSLKPLEFKGDAISLIGQGEMDFSRRINLQFYSIPGENESNIQFFRQVFGEVSQQTLLIEVDGTLDVPEVHATAFPGINDALQKLLNNLDETPRTSNGVPTVGRRNPTGIFAPK